MLSFPGPKIHVSGPVDVAAAVISTYRGNAVPEPGVARAALNEPSRDSHSLGIDDGSSDRDSDAIERGITARQWGSRKSWSSVPWQEWSKRCHIYWRPSCLQVSQFACPECQGVPVATEGRNPVPVPLSHGTRVHGRELVDRDRTRHRRIPADAVRSREKGIFLAQRLADHLTTRHQVEGPPRVAQQIDTLKQVDAGRALVTSRLPLTATKTRGRSAQNVPGGCWSTS